MKCFRWYHIIDLFDTWGHCCYARRVQMLNIVDMNLLENEGMSPVQSSLVLFLLG